MRALLGALLLLGTGWSWTETRRCGDDEVLRARGAYGGVSFAAIADPLVRHVNGLELVVPESAGTYGVSAGGEIVCGHWGGAIGLSLWGGLDFPDFRAPEMTGQQKTMNFTNGSWRTYMVDLEAMYFPWPRAPVGFGFLLSLGGGHFSYDASGSTFPEWNRHVSDTEFRYGVGLSVRWFVIPHVALRLEGRVLPGDTTTELIPASDVDCPAGYDCFRIGDSSTLNYTRLFSIGLQVSM